MSSISSQMAVCTLAPVLLVSVILIAKTSLTILSAALARFIPEESNLGGRTCFCQSVPYQERCLDFDSPISLIAHDLLQAPHSSTSSIRMVRPEPIGITAITLPSKSLLTPRSPRRTNIFWRYCDGLRGPLVIYDPNDPHKSRYDVDDRESSSSL
jgi:hypothetical protein